MSNVIIMEEKYFKKDGPIAFRLWMFGLALQQLKKTPNKEKATFLLGKVVEFSESAWISARGTKDERDDLQKVIDDLTNITLG